MGGKRQANPVIRDAFQASQDSFSVHPKIVKKLKAFYLANDPDKFFEDFIWYLQLPISGLTERCNYIDRTLDFVAKFACSFLEKPESTEKEKSSEENGEVITNGNADSEGEEDDELPLFLYRLYAWLLDHHEVEGADARLRVCQLLNKLLKYMGEDACIDDDLYNKIYDGMLERLKDKVAEIRSQAVTALQRLQDPKDEECPIIRAYLFHLAHDPNNVVRRTIVRCIGATRLTLPHILERTRDTDEHVRRAAYKFLAEKVHIKSLTIGQREGVLARGLGERSVAVRKVVEKEMIPSWLRLSGNNIVQLLHHLDVGNSDASDASGGDKGGTSSAKSAPAGALEVIFADTPFRELVANFQYLDSEKLIPYNKLSPETVMYWRVLAQFLSEKPGAEEYLEQILPELTPFCGYVRSYVFDTSRQEEGGEDIVNWEFVTKELIHITSIYDLGDEVGRGNLVGLVKELLCSSKTPVSFVPVLVEVFSKVEKSVQQRIEQVAEIISDLKDPLVREDETTGSGDIFSTPPTSASKMEKAKGEDAEVRAKQLEVAKLRVRMNELKDQLDSAVESQNFLLAQEVKAEMDTVESQQLAAEEQIQQLKGQSESVVSVVVPERGDGPGPSIDEEQSEEQPLDDPAVTLKCLKLLVCVLQDPGITSLNATLHTLLEEFVTGAVQSEIASIRKEAILALACCCLRSVENARQHMLLLLQAAHIDVREVRIMAITAVVDLLLKHGLASFITGGGVTPGPADMSNDSSTRPSRVEDPSENGDNGSIENCLESDMVMRGATLTQNELNSQGGNSVVAILSKILDEPDLDLRTEVAEGLCKLMMVGAITSPKLISRLLLIWYNPMTESDSKLRHILGTFFPLYSSMSKQNQLAIEAAFVPTMKILFDAPVTSPISEIDVEDVGMFFVHLTREDMLQSHDPATKSNIIESSTTSIHDSLAMAVCNEILSAPDSFQTKVLIKILTNLQLTWNNFVNLREVKVLSETLLRTVKERSCVRSLERFDRILLECLAKDPSVNPLAASEKRKSLNKSTLSVNSNEENVSPKKKRVLFDPKKLEKDEESLLTPRKSGIENPSAEIENPTSDDESNNSKEKTLTDTVLIPSPVMNERAKGKSNLVDESNVEFTVKDIASSTKVDLAVDPDLEAALDEVSRIEETDDEEDITSIHGDGDADVTVTEESRRNSSKGKKKQNRSKIKSSSSNKDSTILSVTEEDDDDDIFSDTSSVTSVNLSKIPKTSILAASSSDEDDLDEAATMTLKPVPRAPASDKTPTRKSNRKKVSPVSSGTILSASEESPSVTPKVLSRASRSSKSTIQSPPTPTVSSPKTPSTVKKATRSQASSVTTSEVESSQGSSVLGTSRSGRRNSPRIDYKTGKRIEESASKEVESEKDKASKKTNESEDDPKTLGTGRKRGKLTRGSQSGSSNASPVPKRSGRNKK